MKHDPLSLMRGRRKMRRWKKRAAKQGIPFFDYVLRRAFLDGPVRIVASVKPVTMRCWQGSN